MIGQTPYLIEVNARLAGGFIPRLLELTGHDLIRATLLGVAGHPASLDVPAVAAAAAIRFIVPRRAGVFLGVNGVAGAQSCVGVTNVRLYVAPGRYLELRGDFRDRVGHVVATGDTPDAAGANADRALASLDVDLVSAVPPADKIPAQSVTGGVS